jgi:Regulator of RNA terminal phosphate cyclase
MPGKEGKMLRSFFQRLFGQRKHDKDAESLCFKEPANELVEPEPSSGDVAHQEGKEPLKFSPARENTEAVTRPNSLFAFVDLKDPFTTGEIAGDELPGPILSILSTRRFNSLFLFHTPHTRENASATQKEVSRRYPDCQVRLQELFVSDPKDYSSVMGRLARMVRVLIRLPHTGDSYVCVSSGTAEMRAAWFLLTALGVLPAKLLQVGSPARPLFGEANVKEVRMDTSDWQTIRELAMPAQYWFELEGVEELSRKPKSVPAGKPTKRIAARLLILRAIRKPHLPRAYQALRRPWERTGAYLRPSFPIIQFASFNTVSSHSDLDPELVRALRNAA